MLKGWFAQQPPRAGCPGRACWNQSRFWGAHQEGGHSLPTTVHFTQAPVFSPPGHSFPPPPPCSFIKPGKLVFVCLVYVGTKKMSEITAQLMQPAESTPTLLERSTPKLRNWTQLPVWSVDWNCSGQEPPGEGIWGQKYSLGL